ncbi:MAG: hypothetical protein Q9198_003984, partial [Flavoplaca austrocitrina]
MPLSLYELLSVDSHIFNDASFKAVLAQVVEGVHYLEINGLKHSKLWSSHVLLNGKGCVKIEYCVPKVDQDSDLTIGEFLSGLSSEQKKFKMENFPDFCTSDFLAKSRDLDLRELKE